MELAEATGKSVHSLYFHIRLLENVGLIRVREFRRKGKRDEAIYEVVSARLVIRKDNSNPAYVESLIKTVRVALRKAEKEHAAARIRNAESELYAILRLQANLKDNDAKKLRDKIKDLGKWVRKHKRPITEPGTEGIGITCLIVPIGNQG